MKFHLVSLLISATALGAPVLSAADQPPKAISRTPPHYSFDYRKSQIEGEVTVLFTVSSRGDVVHAVVVHSTQRVFEEPTLNAIKKWKFIPGTKDGVAVDTKVSQLVRFVVPEKDSARAIIAASTNPPTTLAVTEVARAK